MFGWGVCAFVRERVCARSVCFVCEILAMAVNGATTFAQFAVRHTVHSCTVIFCAVKCCFRLLFVKTVAVKNCPIPW